MIDFRCLRASQTRPWGGVGPPGCAFRDTFVPLADRENCHRRPTNHHHHRYRRRGGDIDAYGLGAVAKALEPSAGNADHGVEIYHEGFGENRVHRPAAPAREGRERANAIASP
jgi:hypothetical protein